MRHDFRIKTDFSRIYDDARKYSWVYIDSTKIFYVHQLAEHIQKLFDIQKPFYLLSRFEEMYCFLPFEEDVRVLENNETVIIVPGTGINTSTEIKDNQNSFHKVDNCFVEPSQSTEKKNNVDFENSHFTEKCSAQNTEENTSGITVSPCNSFYRTALYSVIDDTKNSKTTEENFTESNFVDESVESHKRKRIRKRKQKKINETVAESDTSLTDISGKKPKIIDSVLISSGKHIRFEGLDNEDVASNSSAINVDNFKVIQNGEVKNRHLINKDLSALLNLRQSSTPLTFTHKRINKEYIPETIDESIINANDNEVINKSNTDVISSKVEKSKESSLINSINKTNLNDDTVSFKVFKIGEDYTPQLSSMILAKILSYDEEGCQYTFKILHGIDQLQEPDGKFSLPKDEQDKNNEISDIITIEKSQLLELTKVKAI